MRQNTCVRLPEELLAKIKEYQAITGIQKVRLFEQALENELERNKDLIKFYNDRANKESV